MKREVKDGRRLRSLDALRGVAVLIVCWFHFTNSNNAFLSDDSWLRLSGKYGYVGVYIFFVISGFILTHVLLTSGYNLKSFHKFVAHRLVRLEPPYLVSIAIVIILNYLSQMSPYYSGDPHVLDFSQVVSHLGYFTGVLEYKWLNPVYWTLGIELQFYLLIAFMFPFLLTSGKKLIFIIVALSFLGVTGVGDPWILKYLPMFLIGIIASLYYDGIIGFRKIAVSILVVLMVMIYSGEVLSALSALLAMCCIFWARLGDIRVFSYLGMISYSLYLLHVPIGMRVINIAARFDSAENIIIQIFALAVALALSIGLSVLLFYFVERPAIEWARKIPYD